jgi:hypothetical protein
VEHQDSDRTGGNFPLPRAGGVPLAHCSQRPQCHRPRQLKIPTLEFQASCFDWPRELPIGGESADVVKIFEDYGQWLLRTPLPKLFVNAEPGSQLVGRSREFFRSWSNQEEVTVRGIHFIQEDSPHEIGLALARFVRQTRPASAIPR